MFLVLIINYPCVGWHDTGPFKLITQEQAPVTVLIHVKESEPVAVSIFIPELEPACRYYTCNMCYIRDKRSTNNISL